MPKIGKINHWELYIDNEGDYRFRFVAKNGKVIAVSSEGYKKKRAALRGIEIINTEVIPVFFVDLHGAVRIN